MKSKSEMRKIMTIDLLEFIEEAQKYKKTLNDSELTITLTEAFYSLIEEHIFKVLCNFDDFNTTEKDTKLFDLLYESIVDKKSE